MLTNPDVAKLGKRHQIYFADTPTLPTQMQTTWKSTTGYVFLASGGAITWRSKKQTTPALLSTKAEYIVISEAGRPHLN